MAVPKAIDAIRAIFTDIVVLQGSKEYDYIANSYLSSLESEIRPSSLGVADVEQKITIHLRRLKGVEVDIDKKIVKIAAGKRLAVSGCRSSNGGIGGLSIHGALSHFPSQRWFICDDVLNFEVVLASGDVVNGNAHENPDLWKALKGGCGSNFGIITRFDFAVFEQGSLWGGKLFYFKPSFYGQLQTLADYLNSPEPDDHMHILVNFDYISVFGDVMGMNDVFYMKGEKGGPHTRSTTLKADTMMLQSSLEKFLVVVDALKSDVAGLTFAITLEHLPVSLIEKSRAEGDTFLGVNPEDGPLVGKRSLLEEIEADAHAKGPASPYRFMSYALTHQDPVSSYRAKNKDSLQAIYKKYDPDGFLQETGAYGGRYLVIR
ncbi:FAD-binding domain-containing protein [Patellaria atrata CBS 101060]|uniref:FAD-binding domain-containing protein n=1 Tax=Patellaria atrata CBS 101060 TaxID=1346257 RepID=A0A9P4VPE6_9PEZI|nr:FAD-binding domain-containing protein [Patellaria atrata CBS 101060]